MAGLRRTLAFLMLSYLFAPAALSKDVVVDMSGLAPADAKQTPPPPKQPQTKSVELNPDDVLLVRCPSKQYPTETRGWAEYHAGLVGSGCLISSFGKQEAHTESFQATRLGTQNIVVGVKQPGGVIEKDCILTVKVVPTVHGETKASQTNVQTFSGSSFSNKTGATMGGTNIINGVSSGTGINTPATQTKSPAITNVTPQTKTPSHSVQDLSKQTVKTYDSK